MSHKYVSRILCVPLWAANIYPSFEDYVIVFNDVFVWPYVWLLSIQERFVIKSWLICYNGTCMFWKLTTCIIVCLIWGSAFHCLLIFGCTHEVSFKITHWSFKVLITNTCPKRKNNQSWSCISKNLKLMQTARFFFLTKLKLDQVPRSAFQVWPINPNQHDKKSDF